MCLKREHIKQVVVLALGLASWKPQLHSDAPLNATEYESSGEIDIKTLWAIPPDPLGYPSPICQACKVSASKNGSNVTASISADAGSSGYQGRLVIGVGLWDGRYFKPMSSDLLLAAGQTVEFQIPIGPDWSVSEIETIFVELD